jgi:hypothetical protein
MIVIELLILETLVVFFLAFPILEPFVKALRQMTALAWLPLLALGLLIGIIPAYGFRPECLPATVFTLFYSIVILKKQPSVIRQRAPSVPLAVFVFILVSAVSLPMFMFAPVFSDDREEQKETARMIKISNPAAAADYFLRIYDNTVTDSAGTENVGTAEAGTAEAGTDDAQTDTPSVSTPSGTASPLIFLIPPENGSAASVDLVCTGLTEKGFTVVTYFRKGYDTPLIDENGKKHFGNPVKILSYWDVFTGAAKYASVNERGKNMERVRRADIEFLLPYIFTLQQDSQPPSVLLAGYGAGGSALAYLAGEKDFVSKYDKLLGAVAIEGRLWSAYRPEPEKVSPLPVSGKITHRLLAWLSGLYIKIQPPRVERKGPLPEAGLPVLYLVSGKSLDWEKGRQPYKAVFDTLDSVSGPVALTAVEGSGPLDFQDFPLTHPVYSFLQQGLKDAKKSVTPVEDTAGIIGNYANFLLERSWETGVPKSQVNGSLFVQSKGLPGLRLQPDMNVSRETLEPEPDEYEYE